MILTRLQLRHYKQYGQLDLVFREGLVGVIGRNGAGKSTLFEAILYCLYGKDEVSNKELIRSAFADPKAPVLLELEFLSGETGYRVRRELRGKKMEVQAELYRNDQLIAKGASAVNDEIVRLLRLDREAFKRSVFSGQRELTQLSDAKGPDRQKMVRKMLGIDRLDDIQQQINADRLALSQEVRGQSANLLSDAEIAEFQRQIAEAAAVLEAGRAALQTEQEKLAALEARRRKEKEKFDQEEARLKRHNELVSEQAAASARSQELETQRQSLESSIAALQQQSEVLERQRPDFAALDEQRRTLAAREALRQKDTNRKAYLEQLQELEQLIAAASARIDDLAVRLSQREALDRQAAEQTNALAVLEKSIQEKRDAFTETHAALKTIDARLAERQQKIAQLEALGGEGACPTCGQPLNNAYHAVLHALRSDLEALEAKERGVLAHTLDTLRTEGIALKEQQERLQEAARQTGEQRSRLKEVEKQHAAESAQLTAHASSRHRIERVLAEIGPVDFDEAAYQTLKEQVEVLDTRWQRFREEENYVNRQLPANRTQLDQVKKQRAELAILLERTGKALEATGYSADAYQAAKTALTGFDERLRAQHAAVQQQNSAVQEQEYRSARAQDRLDQDARIRAQIAGRQAEIGLLEKLASLLQQFKSDILEQVRPGISREASQLFSRITRGRYESIRVDDNFEFSIADGGVYYPIERFSGGEIDLANFCLRIAVTRAIMELSGSGQSVEFLAFDEIFGSQDEERRHDMMLALNLLQEQFRQIYIVSHIESQKDYFPSILEVRAGAEGSSTRWV